MQQTALPVMIDSRSYSQAQMNEALWQLVLESGRPLARMAVLCIGSDKITGDCFGPLTGQLLLQAGVPASDVFGSLDRPVHALTLSDALERLDGRDSLVLAVDACVGDPEHVGCVLMGHGPLRPGGGLGKSLPQAGDIAVSGVAAPDGDAFRNLQNASLGLVYRMAQAAAAAVAAVYRHREELSGPAPALPVLPARPEAGRVSGGDRSAAAGAEAGPAA